MSNEATQFKAGNPGGPGRPKGSRNKLSEAFLKALTDDFEEHGPDTIKALREDSPAQYCNVIAKLMPKLMEVTGGDSGPVEKVEWQILPVTTIDKIGLAES